MTAEKPDCVYQFPQEAGVDCRHPGCHWALCRSCAPVVKYCPNHYTRHQRWEAPREEERPMLERPGKDWRSSAKRAGTKDANPEKTKVSKPSQPKEVKKA